MSVEFDKPIIFSRHALDNMTDRGAEKEEVELAIRTGERLPAKKGTLPFRKNFSYSKQWNGKVNTIRRSR
jgi:hypothetical protein